MIFRPNLRDWISVAACVKLLADKGGEDARS